MTTERASRVARSRSPIDAPTDRRRSSIGRSVEGNPKTTDVNTKTKKNENTQYKDTKQKHIKKNARARGFVLFFI